MQRVLQAIQFTTMKTLVRKHRVHALCTVIRRCEEVVRSRLVDWQHTSECTSDSIVGNMRVDLAKIMVMAILDSVLNVFRIRLAFPNLPIWKVMNGLPHVVKVRQEARLHAK